MTAWSLKINTFEGVHYQKNQYPSTDPVFCDDSGPGNLQIIFLFLDLPLGEQWIEMLCGEEAKKSSLCDSDSAQTPQKETCTRDSWEGNTQGSVCCSSTESRWMLRLCQLHVLWQHIKEEPGSLACEPCSVCPLPARNQTWHTLLNKEFLRLWLQAASLKSISRQWKQNGGRVWENERQCMCEVLQQASWGCVCWKWVRNAQAAPVATLGWSAGADKGESRSAMTGMWKQDIIRSMRAAAQTSNAQQATTKNR